MDNFGDAGICWRLARQLATEHGCSVRLIIDKPDYVLRLLDLKSPMPAPFDASGVRVIDWSEPPDGDDLPEVVIAAFQCRLPAKIHELLDRPRFDGQPLWVNLDYLSAERWVDDAHGLPSHKPSGGTEWFYLPGFTLRSGGLIREHDACPDSTHTTPEPEWLPQRRTNAMRVSLFCYGGQNLGELLDAWNTRASGARERTELADPSAADQPAAALPAADPTAIDLLITAGCDLDDLRRQLGMAAGTSQAERGAARIFVLPWLRQTDYDRLLASCDLNFVRGEDSWIRAIWAGKPFIWRPYPQHNDADRVKLDAFLECCRDNLDGAAFAVLEQMAHAWSLNQGAGAIWPDWLANRAQLSHGFSELRDRIGSQPDQVSRLLAFIQRRLL